MTTTTLGFIACASLDARRGGSNGGSTYRAAPGVLTDVVRMQKALASKTTVVPAGLSREELRQFILSSANR